MLKFGAGRKTLLVSAAAVPLLSGAWCAAAEPATESSEIVVTATRQSQQLSKVPESVSAFTGAKLDKLDIKSFAELAKFTPGVTFNEDRHDVTVRGIQSKAGSGTTGIYIDDTPIQARALGLNSNNTLPAVFDLQRVEVLRGPQGTLFGAGSEGGTVRYITTQPSLTHFSALAHTEVASTEHGGLSYEFGAAMGGPIVADKLGFRVSAWGRRDGGWVTRNNGNDVGQVDKNANRTDTYVLRAALAWAPIPNLLITPSINYEKRDEHNHDEYWVATSNPGSGSFLSGTPDRMADPDRFYLPAVKIEWDGPGVKVISDTAYYDRLERVNGYSGTLYNLSYFQHFTTTGTDPQGVLSDGVTPSTPAGCTDTSTPGDPIDPAKVGQPGCITGQLLNSNGLNLPGFGPYVSQNLITNSQQNVTQEFRVQSLDPKARLTWVAGLFLSFNTQRSTEEIRDPQLPALTQYLFGEDMITAWGEDLLAHGDDYINDTTAHDRQIALFADGTFAITDALKVTAGVRYAWTHFDFHNLNDGPQDLLDDGGIPSTVSGSKDETPFTPKIGLSYQLNADDMIYATVSKGYRIGGAVPPLPVPACGPNPFPTQYNSDSLISYEVGTKDKFFDRKLQLYGSLYYVTWRNSIQAVYVQQCGIQYTANTGNVVSDGFDLQGQWQVTPDFQIEFSAGYNDSHFTHTVADASTGSNLVGQGDVLDVAPWTVTLGAEYDFTIADHSGFVRADYEYDSKRTKPIPAEDPRAGASYDPGLVPDPATTQVSARAGVNYGKVDLALFVENLFDAHPQLDLQHQDGGTALFEATTFRPRTIGLAATYKY